MKVKKLIAELKKMPQNLDVGFSAHDNYEWEICGETISVGHFIKADCTPPEFEDEMWDDAPEEIVFIRG